MESRLLLQLYFLEKGHQSHFIESTAMVATTEVCNLWVLNCEVVCIIKSNLMN